jgi:hypothetical protein
MITHDEKITANGRTFVYRRRTLTDIVDAMRWSNEDSGRPLSSKSGRSSWTGTDSLDAYRDMLQYGWPEAMQDRPTDLDDLFTDAADQLAFLPDVAGAFPIVPAYLSGRPDCMLRPVPQPSDRLRSVTLILDGSFNASTEAETVRRHAFSVMALVAQLEAERVEVAVEIVVSTEVRGQAVVYSSPVRQMGEALQPERLAAMLHPSWLRRCWFAQVEYDHYVQKLAHTGQCRSGFGRAAGVDRSMIEAALPEAQCVIVLPKPGRGNPASAAREAINVRLKA